MLTSAEKKVLFKLLGPETGVKDLNYNGAFPYQRLDWQSILQSARLNRVAPFIYHTLKRNGYGSVVPAQVWREFELIYHSTGLQNMLFYDELKNVLRSFRNADIEVIVLKGAAIAEGILGNVALREMSDIDLLVREDDLERADAKLTELGYTWYEGFQSKDWYKQKHHHLAPRRHPVKRTVIEIHRNLLTDNDQFQLDVSKLWEKTRTIGIEDFEAKALSTENMLIHSCLHFAHSDALVGGIRALSDISRLIKYCEDDIDWDWIIGEAREGNFARYIYYPLFLTSKILNVEIEDQVLEGLRRASSVGWLADRLLKNASEQTILERDDSANLIPRWITARLYRHILNHDDSLAAWVLFAKSILSGNSKNGPEVDRDNVLRIKGAYYPFHLLMRFLLRLGRMTVKGISHRVGMIFAG